LIGEIIVTATTGVRKTFGHYTGSVAPGLRLYVPFVQRITPVSNRLKQDAFSFEVKTRDNVFARIGMTVQYRVQEEDTSKAFFSLENPAETPNDATDPSVVGVGTPADAYPAEEYKGPAGVAGFGLLLALGR
jgi:regulator of protease activity HflC (stomatin/prohibitin superfamily)